MSFATAFAGIATRFAAATGAPFVDAVAIWPGTPVLDDGGSITSPGTPVSLPIKCQFDVVTDRMRQADAYQDKDVRILVLALATPVDTDALITVASGPNAGSWMIAQVGTDPAGVGYECLGRRA
jgi:hypothetical protein